MPALAPALETRDALAPFVGTWVRCRGLGDHVKKHNGHVRTLVRALLVDDPDRGWVRAADHVWAWGPASAELCAHGLWAAVEFEARVSGYESTTPRGVAVRRYSLDAVRAVVPLEGPGDPAAAAVALVVRAFGWERVADLVADLHGEG